MERKIIKIAVIGEKGSGKTSMCEMYINETFDSEIAPTIGVNRFFCDADTDKNQYVLNIFDCEGSVNSPVIEKCVNEVDGIIITFNMEDFSPAVSIERYMNITSGKNIIIFGNKKDLIHNFDYSLLEKYEGIPKFYGSAQSGEEIDSAFGEIVNLIESKMNVKPIEISSKTEEKKAKDGDSDDKNSKCCLLI